MLSIVMPVYNGELFLEQTLLSIISQKFKNYELLIYNDASTDSTKKILEFYCKKDDRIKIFTGLKNINQPNSLNLLIKKTKYDFVALHDADDISHPNRLFEQMKFLINNPNIGLVGTFCRIINSDSKFIRRVKYPTNHREIFNELSKNNCFAQSSIIFKKRIFNKIGKFNQIFNPAQDYDMWSRMSHCTKVANIPKYYLDYREHNSSSTLTLNESSFTSSFLIAKNHRNIGTSKDIIQIINKIKLKTVDLDFIKKIHKKNDLISYEIEKKYANLVILFKLKKYLIFFNELLKFFIYDFFFIYKKILLLLKKSL